MIHFDFAIVNRTLYVTLRFIFQIPPNPKLMFFTNLHLRQVHIQANEIMTKQAVTAKQSPSLPKKRPRMTSLHVTQSHNSFCVAVECERRANPSVETDTDILPQKTDKKNYQGAYDCAI